MTTAFAEPQVDRFIESRYPADAIQIGTYDLAMEVFRSPRLHRLERGGLPFTHGTVDKINGPAHLARRKALSRAFRRALLDSYHEQILRPAVVRAFADVARGTAGEDRPSADLVSFARGVFIQFAASLVGLRGVDTPERARQLQELYVVFAEAENYRHSHAQDDTLLRRAEGARDTFVRDFLNPSLEALAQDENSEPPGTDGEQTLLAMFAAGVDPAWRDPEQMRREAVLFLLASIETSTNLLVNVMRELWSWLDQADRDGAARLADAQFLGAIIEETARLHPNLPESPRIAAEDLELSDGTKVREGQHVIIRKSFANRDRSIFGPTASEFDPNREVPVGVPRYGVSFGSGPHKCIGLPVVINPDGLGSHVHMTRMLLAADARPDESRPPQPGASFIETFDAFPITFDAGRLSSL